MKRLAIVRPLPISVIGGTLGNASRLLTPDPKEAASASAAGSTVDLDLGSAKDIDTVFIGYTNAGAAATPLQVRAGNNADYSLNPLVSSPAPSHSDLFDPTRHFLMMLAAPVSARYVRVTFPASGVIAAIVAAGLSFQAYWGHEWGAGRFIEDTGSADRLFGGGFGINEGVTAGGYQWTFGDLTDDETRQLYAIKRNRGSTRSVLVVEDPEATDGLNERIHWGLFDRLEPYERLLPGATRWSLKIKDWA